LLPYERLYASAFHGLRAGEKMCGFLFYYYPHYVAQHDAGAPAPDRRPTAPRGSAEPAAASGSVHRFTATDATDATDAATAGALSGLDSDDNLSSNNFNVNFNINLNLADDKSCSLMTDNELDIITPWQAKVITETHGHTATVITDVIASWR
jgi:hypothetical protein